MKAIVLINFILQLFLPKARSFLEIFAKLLNVKIIMLAFKNIAKCVQNILFYSI